MIQIKELSQAAKNAKAKDTAKHGDLEMKNRTTQTEWPMKASEHPQSRTVFMIDGNKPNSFNVDLTKEQYEYAALAIKERDELKPWIEAGPRSDQLVVWCTNCGAILAERSWNAALASQWIKKDLPDSEGWWWFNNCHPYGLECRLVQYDGKVLAYWSDSEEGQRLDICEKGTWYKIPEPPKEEL